MTPIRATAVLLALLVLAMCRPDPPDGVRKVLPDRIEFRNGRAFPLPDPDSGMVRIFWCTYNPLSSPARLRAEGAMLLDLFREADLTRILAPDRTSPRLLLDPLESETGMSVQPLPSGSDAILADSLLLARSGTTTLLVTTESRRAKVLGRIILDSPASWEEPSSPHLVVLTYRTEAGIQLMKFPL